MTQDEIRQRIKHLNKQLETAIIPSTWTLNNAVVQITNEINELQKQCQHVYNDDGFCVYCNMLDPARLEEKEATTE